MATTLHLHQTSAFAGLGSYTFTVTTPGLYMASVQALNIPSSGVILTISQNGTPLVTSSAFSGAQEILNASTPITAAASDVITWAVTSGTPGDYKLNSVLVNAAINAVALTV